MPKRERGKRSHDPSVVSSVGAFLEHVDLPDPLSVDVSFDLADALAGLGLGRKVWRHLRAELHLQDDSLASALSAWKQNENKTKAAFESVLPADALAATTSWFEVVSQCAPAEPQAVASVPNAPARRATDASIAQGLPAVLARLPRLPPGAMATEGQEERRQALRRRLQVLLGTEKLTRLRDAASELQSKGTAYAGIYVQRAWEVLAEDVDGVELLADLISTHPEAELQRALRSALQQASESPCSCPAQASRGGEEEVRPWQRRRQRREEFRENILNLIPEAQLLQVLSFVASSLCLCNLAAASSALQVVACSDALWAPVWREAFQQEAEFQGLRARFLRWLSVQCVECRTPTHFEHALLGCRLCESCERGCPRYALVRSGLAMQEYQLSQNALRSLPQLKGATGVVYLRAHVSSLAARLHSQEDLQHLRAKHDVGVTAAGRQRSKREKPMGRASCQSMAREVKGKKRDDDPCCYSATALRRADEHADGSRLRSW